MNEIIVNSTCEALKKFSFWLGKCLINGVFNITDIAGPAIVLIAIGLSIGGYSKAKKAIPCTFIIYLFLQIFRIFI